MAQIQITKPSGALTLTSFGGLEISAPVTDFVIFDTDGENSPLTADELAQSKELQDLLTAGTITAKFAGGDPITDFSEAVATLLDGEAVGGSVFVDVKSLSDLPTAVADLITLEAGKAYRFCANIALDTEEINPNNCVIVGVDAGTHGITKTGAGAIFTGSEGGTFKRLLLVSATGKVFDLNDTTGLKRFIFRDCIVASSNEVGTVKGFKNVFTDVLNFVGNTNGITYDSITKLYSQRNGFDSTNSNAYIKLVGAFSVVNIGASEFEVLSANNAIGVDISGVTSISSGVVNAQFTGDGARTFGTFSKYWTLTGPGVQEVSDSSSIGAMRFEGNTIDTVIPNAGVWTKIAIATVNYSDVERWGHSNGRLEWLGVNPVRKICNSIISFERVNDSRDVEFTIYKGNSISQPVPTKIPDLAIKARMTNTSSVANVEADILFNPNDFIEVWVRNLNDSGNIEIEAKTTNVK